MNLHEECLIKYLVNPLDLFFITEDLKRTNEILAHKIADIDTVAKTKNINYTDV